METLTEGGNLHRTSNEVRDGIVRPGPGQPSNSNLNQVGVKCKVCV